ncbi:hypothetical protein SEA_RONEY_78 [Gordonia phage Roney]|nr:hypothetical protein SEA_RONEY_78 [Gordonia phage Roney]
MEYAFTVTNEKLDFVIIEGRTNSTGMNAILKRFAGLAYPTRAALMHELLENKVAEHKGVRASEHPYSVHMQYVGTLV